MKFTVFLLLFIIVAGRSTEKRHRRKVPISTNSSNIQNEIIKCPKCRRVVQDFDGFVTSANNTSADFYELIYAWTIEVPMDHDIHLTFSWLSEELSPNETSTCGSCKPYFEIIYGYKSEEETFKIDKFYNIRQLTNLSVPSHKAEIRFFSGVQSAESQKLANAAFTISFKAIPLEETWSIITILLVLIPAGFISLVVAYVCVIMKKKEDNHQDVLPPPIPIYVDLDGPDCEFKKCPANGKKHQGRGLRLRTHLSSRLEEPKVITVISSLAEPEVSESSDRPETIVTPDSSNPAPVPIANTKRQFKKKRDPPNKTNLLNRFSRNSVSTPRYTSFNNETYNDDRLSKSDIVIYEKRRVIREKDPQVFKFDEVPTKGEPITQTELDTSVFLHSSSASSPDESARELPFVSPMKN